MPLSRGIASRLWQPLEDQEDRSAYCGSMNTVSATANRQLSSSRDALTDPGRLLAAEFDALPRDLKQLAKAARRRK